MATVRRDYYEVLGLSRGASEREIKTAFRRLARELHPDVSEAADAEERFREAAEAYEVLSKPETRELYDRFGHEGCPAVPPGAALAVPTCWLRSRSTSKTRRPACSEPSPFPSRSRAPRAGETALHPARSPSRVLVARERVGSGPFRHPSSANSYAPRRARSAEAQEQSSARRAKSAAAPVRRPSSGPWTSRFRPVFTTASASG
jgi:curved DNA-binding protein CbpA